VPTNLKEKEMEAFLLTVMVLAYGMFARSVLIFVQFSRALVRMSRRNEAWIASASLADLLRPNAKPFDYKRDLPGWWQAVFDLRLWTLRDFCPKLYE
jgi:hypothetical protein